MPTELSKPETVEEALDALGAPGAMVLGGGTSVGLMLAQRLVEPSRLVYVGRLAELRHVTHDVADGRLRIGAAVTLRELARHPEVCSLVPAVAAAAAVVGNPRVRSVATVGGALAHADPRQDLPPTLLALGAEVVLRSHAGTRWAPLASFATGFMETILSPEELLTEIRIPVVARRRCAYVRFSPQSNADYPTVAVAAAVWQHEDVTLARVALGGAAPTALVLPDWRFATAAPDAEAVSELAEAAADRSSPSGDRLGSADYKRRMVRVWTQRALTACLQP